ncbi:hypothetical protein GQ44DRAFT_502887 [Phaeosphaeriaceae sp. PMI808]|nr:hypothetical protein GQ44DRAFT_502887 [Phaeosphaeriaceae sp. PMI808]
MSGTIIPKSLYKTSLDWGLHAGFYGDTYLPFAQHVRLAPTSSLSLDFSLFSKLPLEIQLYIFSFCDTATLFWLMQVSSTIRKEAQKRFWSDTSTWYAVKATWLLAGGYAGHTHNNISSLGYMRQIIINFGGIQPLHDHIWADGLRVVEPLTEMDKTHRILNFWRVTQRAFPSATHVVLSELDAWEPGASKPEDLRRIAKACPQNLTMYTARLEYEGVSSECLRRHLWQLIRNNNTTHSWELLTQSWDPYCVFPPHKLFNGPVGCYSRYQYMEWCSRNQQRARYILVLQAIEAYYSQNKGLSFNCPVPGCQNLFSCAKKWTAHAIQAKHSTDIVLPSQELEAWFAQHDKKLEELKEQCASLFQAMQIAWGHDGSQQRRDATKEFLQQLQQDPLYTHEQPPENSTIWRFYDVDMSGDVRNDR